MKIDKQNGKIAFSEAAHEYWNVDDNEKYISVTTLIHQFTQPFNKEFWSAYKALEKLIPKENWGIEKKSLLNTKRFNKEILDVYNISEDDLIGNNKVFQMNGIEKIKKHVNAELKFTRILKILFIKILRISP